MDKIYKTLFLLGEEFPEYISRQALNDVFLDLLEVVHDNSVGRLTVESMQNRVDQVFRDKGPDYCCKMYREEAEND